MNKKFFLYLMTSIMVIVFSFGLTACGSDDDKDDDIDTTPITLYTGDKTFVKGATNIESENRFVALINSDNSVEGYHVGDTYLRVNGKSRIKVTVKGKFKTYDNPITEWGCSQSHVKSLQSQGTISSKSDGKYLIYENVGHADILAYSFENGKLESIVTMVSTIYTSEYASYMSERFFMIPYENDNDTYFIGVDALEVESANTLAMLQVYSTSYLSAVYMPASKYLKNSSKAKGKAQTNSDLNKKHLSEIISHLNK